MHKIEKFKEFIEDELDEIRKKGGLSATELDNAGKAIDILKDIAIIEGMEAYAMEGYQTEDVNGTYGRMYPYMASGRSYADDWYGAKRREPMGRYMTRYRGNRYADNEARDKVMGYLESKMKSASTDEEKDMIRRCLEELESD